jgi:hypothetical protein
MSIIPFIFVLIFFLIFSFPFSFTFFCSSSSLIYFSFFLPYLHRKPIVALSFRTQPSQSRNPTKVARTRPRIHLRRRRRPTASLPCSAPRRPSHLLQRVATVRSLSVRRWPPRCIYICIYIYVYIYNIKMIFKFSHF